MEARVGFVPISIITELKLGAEARERQMDEGGSLLQNSRQRAIIEFGMYDELVRQASFNGQGLTVSHLMRLKEAETNFMPGDPYDVLRRNTRLNILGGLIRGAIASPIPQVFI